MEAIQQSMKQIKLPGQAAKPPRKVESQQDRKAARGREKDGAPCETVPARRLLPPDLHRCRGTGGTDKTAPAEAFPSHPQKETFTPGPSLVAAMTSQPTNGPGAKGSGQLTKQTAICFLTCSFCAMPWLKLADYFPTL